MRTLELTEKETLVIFKDVNMADELLKQLGEWASGKQERLVIMVANDVRITTGNNFVVLER